MKLYEFQRGGVAFLLKKKKCMLCDLMGLGKTAQAIVAANVLLKNNTIDKVVVFVPNAIKIQWKNEIYTWAHGTTSCIVDKNTDVRTYDFLVINYEKMTSVDFFHKIQKVCTDYKCCIVLDEAQYIKGRYTKRGMRIRVLQAAYKWILTGTPLMNNPEEIYNINGFLGNNLLGPYSTFKNRHLIKGKYGQVTGFRNLSKLRSKLSGIILRRTREDVDIEFPTKVYETYDIQLSSDERKVYNAVSEVMNKELTDDVRTTRIFEMLTVLKQVCNDTRLLSMSKSVIAKSIVAQYNTDIVSSKLKELKKIISSVDGRVVVFTQFKRMAYIIEKELKEYNPLILTGDNTKEAQELVNKFGGTCKVQSPHKVFIMTQTGKYGLDGLQCADYMVFYDLLWNPKDMEQIEDRIVRIRSEGQHKVIIRLIVSDYDKIEQRIMDILNKKNKMIDTVI